MSQHNSTYCNRAVCPVFREVQSLQGSKSSSSGNDPERLHDYWITVDGPRGLEMGVNVISNKSEHASRLAAEM